MGSIKTKTVPFKAREPRTVKNQTELAAVLGRAVSTVSVWVHDPRWSFGPKGPWSVKKVRAWAAANHEKLGSGHDAPLPAGADALTGEEWADLPAERKAKLRLLISREAKVRLETEVLAGKYIARGEVERGWLERIQACKAGFLALPRSLPGLLDVPDKGTAERVIEEAVTAILNQFAGVT